MKKYTCLFLVLINILLCGCQNTSKNAESHFTTWEDSGDIISNVTVHIEVIDTKNKDGIAVTLTNDTEQYITYGLLYRIDFFDGQTWKTVFKPEAVPAVANQLQPYESADIIFPISDEIKDYCGKYRLVIENLGFVEFDIT